jgi:hypothetical protein
MLTRQKRETRIKNISRLCSTATEPLPLDDLEVLFPAAGGDAFIGPVWDPQPSLTRRIDFHNGIAGLPRSAHPRHRLISRGRSIVWSSS